MRGLPQLIGHSSDDKIDMWDVGLNEIFGYIIGIMVVMIFLEGLFKS